jgi:hypothetical protein
VKCSTDWNEARTAWPRVVQILQPGGGLYWIDQIYTGSRCEFMISAKKEMDFFVEHDAHVVYHKHQMEQLLENFPPHSVLIKADFIQNIVHGRGQETSQSYYGKRQSQFLVFAVWYRKFIDGRWVTRKLYVDYVSSYLSHNSLYFQKCVHHLLNYLSTEIGVDFDKVRLLITFSM